MAFSGQERMDEDRFSDEERRDDSSRNLARGGPSTSTAQVADSSTKETVTLKPKEDTWKPNVVEKRVAMLSTAIYQMLEDCEGTDEDPIVLDNVTGVVLDKVVEYCKKHVDDENDIDVENEEEVKRVADAMDEWDREFLKVDQGLLFEIILAANYLGLRILVKKACNIVAEMIRGKTPAEIRKHFNIKNDFTPTEDEHIRNTNIWED